MIFYFNNKAIDCVYKESIRSMPPGTNPEFNTVLAEITSIYERVRKGRENEVYRISSSDVLPPIGFSEIKEVPIIPVPTVPSFQPKEPYMETKNTRYLDFNKYSGIKNKKYLYFSADTNMIQSDTLEGLSHNYKDLLRSEYYWLNITDPGEVDLAMLHNSFNVHDFTITDIQEQETEEKIEFYQHYIFMSTRLLRELKFRQGLNSNTHVPPRKTTSNSSTQDIPVDMDFNIIMFKNFVITMHDHEWPSITDMLGFLNLISAETILTPDWVLYSVFIELAQDAQYLLGRIEPLLNEYRVDSRINISKMSLVLRENYEIQISLYTIEKFLKPKINILKTLKSKSGMRFDVTFLNLVNSIQDDLTEMLNDLNNMNHILERSQDTFLALLNVEKSKEANDLAEVMKTITQTLVIFIPFRVVPEFFGMNVPIPWQRTKSILPFWIIVLCTLLIALVLYLTTVFYLRRAVSQTRQTDQKIIDKQMRSAHNWRQTIARRSSKLIT